MPRRAIEKACGLIARSGGRGRAARRSCRSASWRCTRRTPGLATHRRFGGWDELWRRLWESSVDVAGPGVDRLVATCAEHDVLGRDRRQRARERAPGHVLQQPARARSRGTRGSPPQADADPPRTPLSRDRRRRRPRAWSRRPAGRVGGLICWENRMPLARYAVYRQRAADLGRADRRRQRWLAREHAPHRDRVRRLRRLGAAVHPGSGVPRRLPGSAPGGTRTYSGGAVRRSSRRRPAR